MSIARNAKKKLNYVTGNMTKEERTMREELYKQIDDAVNDELKAAYEKFSANNSRHESYAVLLEEFEELQNETEQLKYWISVIWSDTKDNAPTDRLMYKLINAARTSRSLVAEAIQTSAMILKFLKYINDKEAENED